MFDLKNYHVFISFFYFLIFLSLYFIRYSLGSIIACKLNNFQMVRHKINRSNQRRFRHGVLGEDSSLSAIIYSPKTKKLRQFPAYV